QKRVGVYFKVQNDQDGLSIFESMSDYIDEMKTEFGPDVNWNWDALGDISIRYQCEDVFSENNREEIKDFFKFWLNKFVNVIRPRMKKLSID
ncbi:DUF4268 domain-containing protein, partial [Bacteroidota bacterium]